MLIMLSKAMQLENHCGTVANVQRISRKSNWHTAKAVVNTQGEVGRQSTKQKAVDIYSEVDASNIVLRKRQRQRKWRE